MIENEEMIIKLVKTRQEFLLKGFFLGLAGSLIGVIFILLFLLDWFRIILIMLSEVYQTITSYIPCTHLISIS